MAQIDILKEILNYSLRKFNYEIIGANIFYLFNNERYAKTELKKTPNKNEFTGVTITYISKLYGKIDSCDILFKDVFVDQKRASINVNISTDEYDWFEQQKPSKRDLYKLALHIERYIGIIGDFGNELTDYLNISMLASQAALQKLAEPQSDSFLPARDIAALVEAPSLDIPLKKEPAEAVKEEFDEKSVMPEEPIKKDLQPDEDIDTIDEQDPTLETTQEKITETIEPVIEEPAEAKEEPTKRRFLGFKFGTGKDQEKSLSSDIQKAEVLGPKSFMSWHIGKDNPDDIVAYLYENDDNEYRLEIEGQGMMQNFKIIPWNKYIDKISEVKISDGITSIGNNAFKSASILGKVALPDSITEIGLSSFEFCSLLESVRFSKALKTIGAFAFSGTESLKEVVLPGSLARIDDYAFDITDELTIKCDFPEQLSLGAGLHASAFTATRSDPKGNISINNYNI